MSVISEPFPASTEQQQALASYPNPYAGNQDDKGEVNLVEDAGTPYAKDIEGKNGGTGDRVGIALIEQEHVIPTTGERMPTSKWEYWTFCIFCKYGLMTFVCEH